MRCSAKLAPRRYPLSTRAVAYSYHLDCRLQRLPLILYLHAVMSFSIPKNIPSFDNSQRALENVYWSYSKGDGRGLPMYKDKPFDFARSPRNRPLWRRKGFLITLFLVVLVILMLFRGQRPDSLFALRRWSPSHSSTVDWTSRAESVRKAFQLSWDGYERHAWGQYFESRS